MPIIASAIKKLRKDRKREKINDHKRLALKRAIKTAMKTKKEDDVQAAISLVGKAEKTHLFHKNKAARFVSRLAKQIPSKKAVKTEKKPAKNKNKITHPKTPLQKQKKSLH